MSVITTLGFSQCELMNHNAVIGIITHFKYSTEIEQFFANRLRKINMHDLHFSKATYILL